MISQSKQLKRKPSYIRDGERFLDRIHDFIWERVVSPYRVLKERLNRVWGYWKISGSDYDFDAHSIYPLLEHKLKRIEHTIINGCAIQEERDLKALRIAIKLANRLAKAGYSDRAFRKHDAKWGEMETWTTPIQDDREEQFYSWHSRRPKAIFEKDKKQERLEFRAVWELEHMLENRERKWFFDILNKYLTSWWE